MSAFADSLFRELCATFFDHALYIFYKPDVIHQEHNHKAILRAKEQVTV